MSGFLLLNKPAGLTSHDVVNRIRAWSKERRVGHAGTLDPFATGLLIVGVGREATREFPKLVGLDKTYEATFVLGASSDTDDVTGNIRPSMIGITPSTEQVTEALQQFIGEIVQVPPAYSAVKIGGKKLYEAARAGKPIEAKPRNVRIYDITDIVMDDRAMTLSCTIHCSSGTYIRAIARDLGRALGTGGYVQTLHRTTIGPFTMEESTPSSDPRLIPINTLLSRL